MRLYRRTTQPTPWGHIAALAAVLVGQFLVSTEVLLTFSLSVLGGLGIAWLILTDERAGLGRLVGWSLMAYGLCVVALSPWLWMMLERIPFQQVGNAYAAESTNLLNLVVPTPVTLGGQWFRFLSEPFAGGSRGGASGYLGVFFVGLVAWAGWALRRIPVPRVLIYVGLVELIMALGPSLQLGGWVGPTLPWSTVSHLPVFDVVSTERFMLYVSLVAAGLVGWAVSRVEHPSRVLATVMLLAAVALVPNVPRAGWWGSAAVPRLISSPSLLQRYVTPGEVAMTLPYFYTGYGTYWQAASGFRLPLADGYLYSGLPSPWNLIQLPNLLVHHEVPSTESAAIQFRALLSMSHVRVVLVQEPATAAELALVGRAGLVSRGVHGGVGVWDVPPHVQQGGQSGPDLFRTALAAVDAAEKQDAVRLIRAAERYAMAGKSVATLTLSRLERGGFLPQNEGHSAVPLPWQRTVWGVAFRGEGPRRVLVVIPWIQADTMAQIVRQVGDPVTSKFWPGPPIARSQPTGMTVGYGEITVTMPTRGP